MNPQQTHLAQITRLCGDFPLEFLDQGRMSKCCYFDDQGQAVLLFHTSYFSDFNQVLY